MTSSMRLMELKRPPGSVTLSALLIALTGAIVLYVGLVRPPEGLVVGSALMVVAAGVWQGFAWARWTALAGGLIALRRSLRCLGNGHGG